jgi:predicted DCC family thiol-disulfide oxidoreductase YuxK
MGSDSALNLQDYQLVLFDGYCNLCTSSVQFIIRRDKKAKFKFASLQSPAGEAMLRKFSLPAKATQSVVLISGNKVYTESTAALQITRHLSGLWPLLYVCIVIPPFIRNAVYRFIARNRFRWFGKRTTCWLPTDALRARFIDE